LAASESSRSLDHLVCAHQDRLWDRDSERPGGFQVHQLELGRLFDRQVGGFRASQGRGTGRSRAAANRSRTSGSGNTSTPGLNAYASVPG